MKHLLYILIAIIFISCQKQVEVDLPYVEPSIVVEGRIESGLPPMVILTKTQGYFDPTDANSLLGTFIHDAQVKVTEGANEFFLDEICTSSIPDSLLPQVAAITGIPEENLQFFNYCVYTSLTQNSFGEPGKTYDLEIITEGDTVTSTTEVPLLVPLDSAWFSPLPALDSLGFMWGRLTDPPEEGNAYRWYAQRINRHTYGVQAGEIKDQQPVAPLGSAFDDKFLNGLTFDFQYNRGESGNIENQDDEGPEEGYFKSGDTVAIKWTTTTYDNYLYLRALENQAATAGSPFASPGNLPFNIVGGIGIWAGYGVSRDTVICE